MHFTASFRRAATISIFGTLVAGCSSAGVPTANSASNSAGDARTLANGYGVRAAQPQARTGGWMSPDAKKKGKNLIYWGDYYNNTITVYSSKGVNGKEVGQITTGLSDPERLFVDKKFNVYSTNIGSGTITAYKPGATSPFLTISDGVDRPTGITVDGAGTVYCANVGNNTITEYPKGSTSPSVTLSLSASAEYLATDAKDNLYAALGGYVYEFPAGSTGGGTNLGLPSGAGALEVDRSGNLIVVYGSAVEYFPAGKTEPSNTIDVSGTPFSLSLSANEKELYASVESETGSSFSVQNIAYPSGTSFSSKLSTDAGNWPVAVSPDNALGT